MINDEGSSCLFQILDQMTCMNTHQQLYHEACINDSWNAIKPLQFFDLLHRNIYAPYLTAKIIGSLWIIYRTQLAIVWARRGCGVRNRRGTVEEHGEQCCGTAGATVPGEADHIRCDRYYLLALHRIARARVCVPVTCHLSPPDRLRPPAILMKVEQACTLALPMSSAACKPGTAVAATTDLGPL